MVADQQRAAAFRHLLNAPFLQPVDGMNEQPDDEADEELRHQAVDVRRHGDIEQRRGQKELRNRQPQREQRHGNDGGNHHEQGVENIVGGDDARLVAFLAARLDEGVERHDVEAAKQPQQGDVQQHAPVRGLPECTQKIISAVGKPGGQAGCVGIQARPVEVDAENRQADSAERHQADFHLAAGEFFAQQRTDADAEREHRQEQDENAFIAVQHVFGEGGKLRQNRCPVKPEPRSPEQRQPDGAVTVRKFQVAPGFTHRIPVDAQLGVGGWRMRHAAADPVPRNGHGDNRRRRQQRAVIGHRQPGAENLAGQDGDERAHFDHAVAADQFFLAQMLRQVGVLNRAEQR